MMKFHCSKTPPWEGISSFKLKSARLAEGVWRKAKAHP
jgi:hypothetical protein